MKTERRQTEYIYMRLGERERARLWANQAVHGKRDNILWTR